MRDAKSADRRRRLRLIRDLEQRSATRYRSAVAALTVAADTETARWNTEQLRQELLVDCQARLSDRFEIDIPGAAPIEIRTDRPYIVIGSDPVCDLHLDHEEINPFHSLLHWIDGHLFCCDIAPQTSLFPNRNSSSNGRWIGDQPIPIGPYQLRRVDEELVELPEYSPLDRSLRLASEYPLLALQFDGVEQSDNVWPINRVLTLIGRGPQCKLRLSDKSIAYVQACLLRTSNGCWLIDLVNDASIGVNGQAIQIAPVDVGDVLQLGNFRVEVVTMAIPSVVPIVKTTTTKPLPPIRFDRMPASKSQPTVNQNQSHSVAAATATCVLTTPPKPKVPVLPKPKEIVRGTKTEPESEAMQPMTAASHTTKTEVTATNETIAQYIALQQSQLVTLKKRLERLKQIYDEATGQLISKKMRDQLEQPVLETMSCYDSMHAALSELIQTVERETAVS